MKSEVFFTNIKDKIIEHLKTAECQIMVAVAWLTDEDIIRILYQQSEAGIEVKVVISDSKENFKNTANLNRFIKNGGKLFVATNNFLHHKFCVIDNSTIINGSYNWTYYARKNEENVIVMSLDKDNYDDEKMLKQFQAKLNFFCSKLSVFVDSKDCLDSFKETGKDTAFVLAQLDEEEILLRKELEDAVRKSIDEALSLKIPISQMILERMNLDGGGVEFIKRILHDEISSGEMKSGFKKLAEPIPHRVDLSLEYLVSRPKFEKLFTEKEINFCKKLMEKYKL
ncbi:MAG: hypothetical protein KUL78_00370 [Flavobacterium sp.]|nr:hypothetical protein [Flavobacterium sp.]